MNNTIIHLVGYPGVGKLTIGRELCARIDARLLDNQQILNLIFGVIDADGKTPVPDPVWDEIDKVRDAVFRAIETSARPDRSFVLTNVLIDNEVQDRPVYDRVVELAARRKALFVPVILTADADEILRRLVLPERAARHSPIDVERARAFMQTRPLLPVIHPNLLRLDTTARSPADTAATIMAHVESLSR